jgi:hypothetical protein
LIRAVALSKRYNCSREFALFPMRQCGGLLNGPLWRYSIFMKLTIDLPPAQAERLRQEAERLGLEPEHLARAAILDLLAAHDGDFEAAAQRVLQKNEELYRRLA